MIAELWARALPCLLAALALAAGLLGFGRAQRNAGRAEAQADITTRTLEIKDAQDAAAARAAGTDVVGRLRDGSF